MATGVEHHPSSLQPPQEPLWATCNYNGSIEQVGAAEQTVSKLRWDDLLQAESTEFLERTLRTTFRISHLKHREPSTRRSAPSRKTCREAAIKKGETRINKPPLLLLLPFTSHGTEWHHLGIMDPPLTAALHFKGR